MAAGALADRGLVALYVLGAVSVGTLVAMLNALGFRLHAEPFGLSLGAISLIYLVYALGTGSSTVSGRLADRLDRRQGLRAGFVMGTGGLEEAAVGQEGGSSVMIQRWGG